MPKTAHSERNIHERGPYQFQVKIRRNGEYITQTFETLTQARKFRDTTLGKVLAHEYTDTKKERRTTLRVLLERYLAEITPTKKGARQEANRIKAWMKTDLAAYPIVAIEPKDIADWIAAQHGKAPTTISNSVNLLSAIFKKAREWGYRVDNPCQGVSRPKARPARFAAMHEKDQVRLVEACERGPKWLPLVVKIALTTGMRQGERGQAQGKTGGLIRPRQASLIAPPAYSAKWRASLKLRKPKVALRFCTSVFQVNCAPN
jgi:integrase